MRARTCLAAALASLALAGCGRSSQPAGAAVGPTPALAAPHHRLIPTVKIARPVGWPAGRTPLAAPGLRVEALARGLVHPRSLLVLPDGDVLVAETNGPAHPPPTGLRAIAEKLVMGMVGADVPSPNRIILLRGRGPDGTAQSRSVFLQGLNSPFGMALVGDQLYVADTDALLRFPYVTGETRITAPAVKVADLPAGPIDHHWTKTIAVARGGGALFVSIGSNSNIGENGMAAEKGRARVVEIDLAGGRIQPFATGLRNAVGLAVDPATGALWAAVNERDELGDHLPPDYLTDVRRGAFYGWPYSYWGRHVDPRVKPQRPDLVAAAVTPDYALGAHVAPLGLAFAHGAALGARFGDGAFVGEHGSWNRSVLSGYEVVFVAFANGRPAGKPQAVLGGFLNRKGEAMGRPVGVAVDASGALLVADDVGGAVWRVSAR
ncbi:MAG TPA: sorbosone dehydrogenase family protein [Caulobacteraceae bacterium]|nr:sorbosone dehydrogenase family protein [Caulobacteraceae bacterium]